MKTWFSALVIAGCIAGLANTASAETPPVPTSTPPPPGVTSVPPRLDLRIVASPRTTDWIITLSWNEIPSADTYVLAGTLRANREKYTDPCDNPPAETDNRTISIDQTISAPTTILEIPLPLLPADERWNVYLEQLSLRAFDANDAQIVGVIQGSIVESCGFAEAQATEQAEASRPPIRLPETGGTSPDAQGRGASLIWFAVLSGAAVALGLCVRRRALRR